MIQSGTIVRADVAGERSGRSKGFGTVLFATHEEASKAIDEFDGANLDGRVIEVRWDRGTVKSPIKKAPLKDIRVKQDYAEKKAVEKPILAGETSALYVGNLAWSMTR
jgi:RNA recognition motif-containing protein